ncbi:CAMKK/CAMKK-META protein kinase [Allomyces macrogynus ATCC 38327]|uniref:CAMKK/CAMKK-META protein kinase n=1 Tax=Allomyces macrogynus (strain ATCC 38327) TaxID=578462 RepID=A0A0L0SU52_ALLM3|nr:CAMKK/CAMKK-META protein kinase [Allomyces macrogynus ATCC 38327]|eukprot:KNE65869.1 CAMKK/CAMKK-META protein kinase [Allomyces macrogynus ATCC 38327]
MSASLLSPTAAPARVASPPPARPSASGVAPSSSFAAAVTASLLNQGLLDKDRPTTSLPVSASPITSPNLTPSKPPSVYHQKRRLSASKDLFSPVRESIATDVEQDDEGTSRINQYILSKFLGKGAYGTVYLAIDEQTKTEYAIKEFSKSRLRRAQWAMNPRQRMAAMRGRGRGRGGMPGAGGPGRSPFSQDDDDIIHREIAILKRLHHPHCVKLFEVIEVPDGDQIYMVFEMCHGGSIMNIESGDTEPFSEDRARDYFQQMVLGIEYLHEHHIIHRDIKPDNLLLSADNELKIVDFGVSEMFASKDQVAGSAGSPAFVAPELCRITSSTGLNVSGRACDIWSMGVTLYCMVYGRLPFTGRSVVELYKSIAEDEPDFTPPRAKLRAQRHRSTQPSSGSGLARTESGFTDGSASALTPPTLAAMDPALVDLLRRMLDKNPATRITLDAIRTHVWVTDYDMYELPSKEDNVAVVIRPEDITAEEMSAAISKANPIWAVMRFIANLRRKSNASSRRSSVSSAVVDPDRAASPKLGIDVESLRAETPVLARAQPVVAPAAEHSTAPAPALAQADSAADIATPEPSATATVPSATSLPAPPNFGLATGGGAAAPLFTGSTSSLHRPKGPPVPLQISAASVHSTSTTATSTSRLHPTTPPAHAPASFTPGGVPAMIPSGPNTPRTPRSGRPPPSPRRPGQHIPPAGSPTSGAPPVPSPPHSLATNGGHGSVGTAHSAAVSAAAAAHANAGYGTAGQSGTSGHRVDHGRARDSKCACVIS